MKNRIALARDRRTHFSIGQYARHNSRFPGAPGNVLQTGVAFSRKFKLEAVRLVKDRGVAVAQAAHDLDLQENVLRKRIGEASTDPRHAFSGRGRMKPEQLAIDRPREEVAKLKAERDILKKPAPYFAREAI